MALASCQPSVPSHYTESDEAPAIYPDYTEVTVPINLAPPHFTIDTEGDDFCTRMTAGSKEDVYAGKNVCPSIDEWQKLVHEGDVTVEVFVQKKNLWSRLKPFTIHVSNDSIDPYLAYRLISPSYVTFEDLTIQQRCLENYDETLIYGNMINSTEKDGQCINCHAFQSYNPQRMQMHMRQAKGGTFITMDGKSKKVKMSYTLATYPRENQPDSIVKSAGVYPAWHPTLPLIAYSSNHTGQSFHTRDLNKIEVYDSYSDLILYDVNKEQIIPIEQDTTELACYPAWSPDGKWLYYCSAHFDRSDSIPNRDFDVIMHYQDIHYNIYRRSFDAGKMSFGNREMVYNAVQDSMSATLPRISPDGRYMMFTRGRFGVFHIWHNDADLYMMNLTDGSVRNMKELNSPSVESYHSWSSNGRWVVFSSRRNDGNFTRPFIAHIDSKGQCTRPLELPCQDPNFHREFLRSYNVPEFISGPVTITPQEIAAIE